MTAPKRDGTEKNPSTEKEEELEIEDPQVRSCLTAVEVLTCILEVAHGEAMVVGGTAVNAGIKTRKSRDIDVDIPEQYTTTGKEDAIRKAVWEQGGKVTRLRKHSVTAILRSGTGNTTIGLSIRAKPCSIKTRRRKWVKNRTLSVAPIEYVLGNKVRERTIAKGTILEKDIYDVVATARVRPEVLQQAFAGVPGRKRKQIADRIERKLKTDPNWRGDRGDRGKVEEPVFTELTGNNLWLAAIELFRYGPEQYFQKVMREKEEKRKEARRKNRHGTGGQGR